jgi:thioredoxin 1
MNELHLSVTDENFDDQVLNSDRPVLVDFWAAWCGPCKAIEPVVKELADEYEGRINVKKLNVDENPQTARNYGIRSIPTLLLFDKGEVKENTIGVQSKTNLENMIGPYIT